MKQIFTVIFCLFLIGCSKDTVPNLSSEYILSEITKKVSFDNSEEEKLKDQSVAQKYGISPSDIENGVVYYTKDKEKSDRIIIVKAKSKETLENVERALSSEIVSISDSWKDNDAEMKKIEDHIFKTKDVYVIMAISNKSKQIEKAFDKCFE